MEMEERFRGKDVYVQFKDLPPRQVVSQSGHFTFTGAMGSMIGLRRPNGEEILVSTSVIISITPR